MRIIPLFPPMFEPEIDFHPLPLPPKRKRRPQDVLAIEWFFGMLAACLLLAVGAALIVLAFSVGAAASWFVAFTS